MTDTGDYVYQDSHKFRNLEERRLPRQVTGGNRALENLSRTNATEQPSKICQCRETETGWSWSRTPSSPEHTAPVSLKLLHRNGEHFNFFSKDCTTLVTNPNGDLRKLAS